MEELTIAPVIEEDLDYIDLDERLKHLSVEQLNEMIVKYYNGSNVKSLIEEYELSVSSNVFVKVLPKIVTDQECPFCETLLVKKRMSKMDYKNGFLNTEIPFCSECGHKDAEHCTCKNCIAKRQEEKQNALIEKKKMIEKHYAKSSFEHIDEEDLSLEDYVYLSTVLRAALSENLAFINPLNSQTEILTPTGDFNAKIVRHLTSRGIIKPHPMSDVDAFTGDEENAFPNVYYIYNVHYQVTINPKKDEYEDMINRVLYPDIELFNIDDCYELWREIALQECLEYLFYSLNKVRFEFSAGEKTLAVFNELLNNFSVAQIYGIIHNSISNATKVYQEGQITKKHAANIVISNCEHYGKRAISENWTVRQFSRNYDIPQTILSKTFFTNILNISDGFYNVPSKEYLRDNTALEKSTEIDEVLENEKTCSELEFLSDIRKNMFDILYNLEQVRNERDDHEKLKASFKHTSLRLLDTYMQIDKRLDNLLDENRKR